MLEDHFKLKTEDYIKSGRISRKQLDAFKELVKSDGRFPDLPEQMQVLFLAACNDVPNLAWKTALAYFKTRNASSEIFGNRNIDLPDLQRNLETIKMFYIPTRTDCNSAIIMCRLEDPSYSKYDILSQMKTTAMLSDANMLEENPPESVTSIVDLDKFTVWLLPRLSLSVLLKFSAYLQDGFPFKISKIILINSSSVVKGIMKIMQFCMKSELIDKFSIHYKGFDRDEFFKNHIPAKCMPSDYGGELPSIKKLQELSVNRLRHMRSFFEEEEMFRQKFVTNN